MALCLRSSALRSTIYDLRFSRIRGITPAGSTNIFNTLKSSGLLDADGFLLQNPRLSGWQSLFPSTPAGLLSAINDQLEVCFTEHQFHSDLNRRTIACFDATLNAIPEPGSLGLVLVGMLYATLRVPRKIIGD